MEILSNEIKAVPLWGQDASSRSAILLYNFIPGNGPVPSSLHGEYGGRIHSIQRRNA